jgi:hypothetical protein
MDRYNFKATSDGCTKETIVLTGDLKSCMKSWNVFWSQGFDGAIEIIRCSDGSTLKFGKFGQQSKADSLMLVHMKANEARRKTFEARRKTLANSDQFAIKNSKVELYRLLLDDPNPSDSEISIMYELSKDSDIQAIF